MVGDEGEDLSFPLGELGGMSDAVSARRCGW
jgi:hypothetical protein